MAGTLTLVAYRNGVQADISGLAGITDYVFSWKSSTGGAVDQTDGRCITGTPLRVVFDPTDGPSNGHTISLYDRHSIDVLSGTGVSLSGTLTSEKSPGMSGTDGSTAFVIPRAISSPLNLVISGAGSEKSGVFTMYVKN